MVLLSVMKRVTNLGCCLEHNESLPVLRHRRYSRRAAIFSGWVTSSEDGANRLFLQRELRSDESDCR